MKEFRFALGRTVPVVVSYIFVGVAFGVLIHQAGYSILWALFAAVFIYAGSMQIVLVSMLVSGMPLWSVVLTTFFINARHVFYGIGFIERFRAMGRLKYAYMALTVTDETYSLLCSVSCPPEIDGRRVDFYINLICHILWVLSCTAGAVLGEVLPFNLAGIEFAATALFAAICVDQWRKFGSHIPVIAGLISGVGFWFLLGPDKFILPALSASLVVLALLRDVVSRRMGGVRLER